jgi:1-acyl-sn-glycerol-3-phosphate acyltransferase
MNEGAEVLLTGATGFLGKVVLHELLRRREELGVARVHALVRRRRGVSPEARFRSEVLGSPCFSRLPESWTEHVVPVAGDLASEAAGLAPEARDALCARTTHVIHCAASVEFHLPIAQAAAANVTSALHVLELARACPDLRSLVDVSTAYVTPHPGDRVPVEEVLAPLRRPAAETYGEILAGGYADPNDEGGLLAVTGHPNTYTLTKCLAEHLLVERRGSVPLTLVRPSIISAAHRHPFPGWIDSPAAFALFVMMIGSGRMRAVVAKRRSRLDIVPVDAVADRILASAFRPSPAARQAGVAVPIRHAVAGSERSPSLVLCGERIQKFFARNPLGDGSGPLARVHYIGPDGLRYRLWHLAQHRLRRESKPIAERLADTNRRFAYFTLNTFRFRSSLPLRDPDFDVARYLDTVCRGIYQHLLGGDKREVNLAGRAHRRRRGDLGWAASQPRGNLFIRAAAWGVAKAFRRGVDRVTVDVESFRRGRAATPDDAVVVIAPSHRSYLDFVLISFLCFARPDLGLSIPHVAAAVEFARIPLLGRLFRHLHAFYLERGRGREDKALTQAVHALAADGETLEFFIEGQRSRSRRCLPPRRGLLRSLQATGRPVTLLPVSISYDHVPEQAAFVVELEGAPKPPMRLRDLLGWTGRLLRGQVELGRIHLACGRPVGLDLASDVHAVAREVVGQLQAETVTTTHHLRGFLSRNDLKDVDLDWLVQALERRGGRVLEVARREQAVPDVIERCMRYQFLHLFYPEATLAYAGNPAVEHHIRRNGYAPGHALDPEAELSDPRVRSVLRALFEPVRADYAGTAGVLAERLRATTDVPEPAEVTRERTGAHRPDIEGAFEDLVERGALVRDAESGRHAFGPAATEIGSYAHLCARVDAGMDPA